MAQEAEIDVTQMAGLMPGLPQDERLRVQFYSRPIYDKLTTEGAEVPPAQAREWAKEHADDPRAADILAEMTKPGRHINAPVSIPPAGRKFYKDVEFIRIAVPGRIQQVTEHKVRPYHIQRFARQYAAWKAGQNQDAVSGTPLSVLTAIVPPILRPAQVEDLKAANVHTVEQLVAMSDVQGQGFMGIHAVKQKAQAYLDASKSEAPLAHLRSENERLSAQLAAQNAALKEMAERMERMEKRKNSNER